jgi:hypothetical protein
MNLLTTHFLDKPDTDEFRGHRTDVFSRSLSSRQLALPINDAFLRQVDGGRAAGLSLTSVALLRCLVTPLSSSGTSNVARAFLRSRPTALRAFMTKTNRKPANDTTPLVHGGATLPSVVIDDYNNEARDRKGFIGDGANKKSFRDKVDQQRKLLRELARDPFGKVATKELKKKDIDALLCGEDAEAAAMIFGAVEEFSRDFAAVIKKFLNEKSWKKTERIAVGGGFRQRRVGELVIARTMMLLRGDGVEIELVPIAHHPDDAGLIGSVHLMPEWMLKGHDAILAVDIGGTNVRAGVVRFGKDKRSTSKDAAVAASLIWKHAEENPSRTATVAKLSEMLEELVTKAAEAELNLAPLIGIGCPGVIEADGAIVRGGQNLPGGNWESDHFNLPAALVKSIPKINEGETFVMMHNDGVVQGLSQIPLMTDVSSWAILTIGTGLGNAHFTNRSQN